MIAFLTIALIHLLGVASPGPDFAIVTRNSLTYSRRAGISTAAGIALGLQVHVLYSLLGIGLIISRSILLFTIIKYIGACYLLYIGWKALTAKTAGTTHVRAERRKDIPIGQAFRMGLLTNVLNPKVTLFMLALFTQVIDPATPILVQTFYGMYMGVATFLWFTMLACIFNLPPVRHTFDRIGLAVERTMGAILMALGLRVAFATQE